ncbi:MAG: outer membrane protein assembly factor, partial [Gammaproteobacteria bacterium]|nr:outer membrane protein assembly factor [Gammaproteobacteria bacterium]
AEAAADINIEGESGPRYRFGELRLSEQPLNEEFIRRLAKIREGDPYDARELTALNRNLSDAGYFQQVEVNPRRDEAENGEVPVDLLLEAAKRHAWRAGVGFATDTGPRMSLGYENRYVNRRGHRFESELRLSQIEPGLTADYIIPGEDPHRENYSLGARLLHEESDSVYSDSATLVAKQTLKSKNWTQTRFIELLYEQSEVGSDKVDATLLMPGISF